MRQILTEYFVKYELYPHPDTRCPPPSMLFRPHEYSLCAPLDTFCLWSPQKPRSNIPAMLTAYTRSRTTHVHLFTLQCRPTVGIGWGWQKWLSVWTCFRKIWFHCWNTGAHLLQNGGMCIRACFFLFCLEYVYWFCFKVKKKKPVFAMRCMLNSAKIQWKYSLNLFNTFFFVIYSRLLWYLDFFIF